MNINEIDIFIPIRAGSERVPDKSIRPFLDTTLLEIAVNKAKQVFTQDNISLNSNCPNSLEIAKSLNINIYPRESSLCQSDVTLDHFFYDYAKKSKFNYICMLNPISPCLKVSTLKNSAQFFLDKKLKNLICSTRSNLHSFVDEKAVNFLNTGALSKTQDNQYIDTACWSFVFWNKEDLIEKYEKTGHFIFSSPINFFPVSIFEGIKISTEQDFQEALLIYEFLKKKNPEEY